MTVNTADDHHARALAGAHDALGFGDVSYSNLVPAVFEMLGEVVCGLTAATRKRLTNSPVGHNLRTDDISKSTPRSKENHAVHNRPC